MEITYNRNARNDKVGKTIKISEFSLFSVLRVVVRIKVGLTLLSEILE